MKRFDFEGAAAARAGVAARGGARGDARAASPRPAVAHAASPVLAPAAPPTRRDFLLGAAAVTATLGSVPLLGGCGLLAPQDDPTDSEDSDGAFGRGGGTLAFASHWPYSLDPFYLQELAGTQIAHCLLDPLVRYDYREKKLVSAAAESWQVTEDGTVFTFKLIKEARFHNNEPVTAADFKFSWERILRKDPFDERSGNASQLAVIQGARELLEGEADEATGIKVLDDLTLEVTLTSPFHEFLQVLSYPAFAPLCAKSMEDDFFAFEREPIGNGAFKLELNLTETDGILWLTRFDDYRGTPALLKSIEFWFFFADMRLPEPADDEVILWEAADRSRGKLGALGAAKRLGRWQTASEGAGKGAGQLADMSGVRPAAGGSAGTRQVADDVLRSYEEKTYESFQFEEVDVAAVPAGALDEARARYGESQDGYTASPGSQTLTGEESCTQFLLLNFAAAPLDNPKVREALSYAIDRETLCEKLLQGNCSPAGGIIPPGVEGFRDGAWPAATYDIDKAKQLLNDAGYPEGEGLAPLTLVVWDTESDIWLFKAIEANLYAAGFRVRTVKVATEEDFWSAMKDSAGIGSTGWIADFPLMENFLGSLFASFGSYNQLGYHRQEVDEGIIKARAVADKGERLAAFQAVDDLLAADTPVVPLYYTHLALVCSDRVNNLYVAPDGIADLKKTWLSQ